MTGIRPTRSWKVPFVAIICIWMMFSVASAGGTSGPMPEWPIDDAEECTEAVPAATSMAGVLDDGREIALDIHFLLDEVSISRAQGIMSQMQKAYSPLNIVLRGTYQEVSYPAQKMAQEFPTSAPVPSSDSSYLFQLSKQTMGGQRPLNTDVVYLLTSDHITGGTAGVADCIGGIRYPNRAFGIGEEEPDPPPSQSLNFCCTWATAKIAAHEVAHLLGAHHHYANCAEGAPAAVEDRHLLTCTMMFNDVGAVNLRFSTLEGAVVRGHAVQYADRPPEQPKPQPSTEPSPAPSEDPGSLRSIDLNLSGHLIARGIVEAQDEEPCRAGVPVELQWLTEEGEWERLRTTRTLSDGTFRVRLPDAPGWYRAILYESFAEDAQYEYDCSPAESASRRHRHS